MPQKVSIHVPVGAIFTELTVVSIDSSKLVTVRCSCGAQKQVVKYQLTQGKTRSCGCMARAWQSKAHRTHGLRHHSLYKTWFEMHERCTNPAKDNFKHYGGRGIKVCERWAEFPEFLVDMGERPDGMTLDRYPDHNGNYEPSNCRWATKHEQMSNMRTNRYIVVNGERMMMSDAARRFGLSVQLIQKRLDVLRWDDTRSATEPARKSNRSNHRAAGR